MSKIKTNSKAFKYGVRLFPLVAGIVLLLSYWNGRGEASRVPSDQPVPGKTVDAFQKVQDEVTFEPTVDPLEYRYQAPPGRVLEHDFNIRHEIVLRMPKNPMDLSQGDVDPQTINLTYKGTVVTAAYASPVEGRLLLGFEVPRIEMISNQETKASDYKSSIRQ